MSRKRDRLLKHSILLVVTSKVERTERVRERTRHRVRVRVRGRDGVRERFRGNVRIGVEIVLGGRER